MLSCPSSINGIKAEASFKNSPRHVTAHFKTMRHLSYHLERVSSKYSQLLADDLA